MESLSKNMTFKDWKGTFLQQYSHPQNNETTALTIKSIWHIFLIHYVLGKRKNLYKDQNNVNRFSPINSTFTVHSIILLKFI